MLSGFLCFPVSFCMFTVFRSSRRKTRSHPLPHSPQLFPIFGYLAASAAPTFPSGFPSSLGTSVIRRIPRHRNCRGFTDFSLAPRRLRQTMRKCPLKFHTVNLPHLRRSRFTRRKSYAYGNCGILEIWIKSRLRTAEGTRGRWDGWDDLSNQLLIDSWLSFRGESSGDVKMCAFPVRSDLRLITIFWKMQTDVLSASLGFSAEPCNGVRPVMFTRSETNDAFPSICRGDANRRHLGKRVTDF